MRRRRYFVGLTAAIMAAGSIIIAGPAGAITNDCLETTNPAASGNSSGLTVACTFTNAGAASAIRIVDQPNANWASGAARTVNVTFQVTSNTTTGKTVIKTAALSTSQLNIGTADVNHNIEGNGLNAGTFIKAVNTSTKVVTLSGPVLMGKTKNGSPLIKCPTVNGSTPTSCAASVPVPIKVANTFNRTVINGQTYTASNQVTSVGTTSTSGANFNAADVGAGISGGSLPDGATISVVDDATTVHLVCTGCSGASGGFGAPTPTLAQGPGTTSVPLPITIERASAPTSTRFITDASITGHTTTTAVINSPTAEFASTDIGLPVVGSPTTLVPAGARITAVALDGSNATINKPAVNHAASIKLIVGVPLKVAPANGNTAATMALVLQVDPTLSPSSPPCAANKVSGFQIPLGWKNPGSYDTGNNLGSHQFAGNAYPGTSTAQFDFSTASVTFSAFLEQNTTTTGGVGVTNDYDVIFEFLPTALGLCSGTGVAQSLSFFGISASQASNPTFTGPAGGGGIRGLAAMPQNTSQLYTGTAGAFHGAYVVTGAAAGSTNPDIVRPQPGNSNACTVSSPATIQLGC